MPSKPRAYAEQARADYAVYVTSGEPLYAALAEHHRLQLLQMALEKLAKAFLYHAEPDARYGHDVALSAIKRLRSHEIAAAVGVKLAKLSQMLDDAKPIFLQIEAASPSVGNDGPGLTREQSERTANVEYPWQSNVNDSTSWVTPASHQFPVVRDLRAAPRSITAVRLLGRLINAALVVLPGS